MWNIKDRSQTKCGCSFHVVKVLNVEKDIVDVVKIRRLTYFGHVTCMKSSRLPHRAYLFMAIHMDTGTEEGRRRNGWTIFGKTATMNIFLKFYLIYQAKGNATNMPLEHK